MISNNELRSYVVERFIYLEKEYGFSRTISENGNIGIDFYYVTGNVGIEVKLYWKTMTIYTLVIKLNNGKMPGDYYMQQGRRHRIPLYEVVDIFLKIPVEKINMKVPENNQEAWFAEEAVKRRIMTSAYFLKRYIAEIIDAGEKIFENIEN